MPGTSTVVFGGVLLGVFGAQATPSYVGLSAFSVGLYQVNVAVPASAPRGDAVAVYLSVGTALSNRVNIAIQ